MNKIKQFQLERMSNIAKQSQDKKLKKIVQQFLNSQLPHRYSYNFDWLGRPIIQFPQDILAMQEITWNIKPDLIVETGIAHGGSLIFYASMLELLGKGEVLGIDIDIRKHNLKEIERHPMFKRITMLEGSSISPEIIRKVSKVAKKRNKILVCLDSLHTHDHVLRELELYSPYVSKGSYLVVFDTVIECMGKSIFRDKPWDVGNNPATAVNIFLKKNNNFVVDQKIENKLLITCAPGGYLKRVK